MIKVSVRLLGEYSTYARNALFLELEEASAVHDLVDALFSRLDHSFRDSFVDPPAENLSQRSLVLVTGVEMGALSGLKTVLHDLDEVCLIPVSHGG